MNRCAPATQPTMYFIGVTTGHSSINPVFPRWVKRLGLGDAILRGWDFPLHDRPEIYRAAIEFIKSDPLSMGALVTTHKLDVYSAARDLFDELDPLTCELGEVSSIFKRGGRLHGRAVDPITVGHALAAVLPPQGFAADAEAAILGAGGAGTALTWRLNHLGTPLARPQRIHLVDRSQARLEHVSALHRTWRNPVPLICHRVERPVAADRVVSELPPGSLVVNATGAGKDVPGSPLTARARFPERGVAWEFNYRGELLFLQQAGAQAVERSLSISDGWNYFLHGWTRVIADVFAVDIPSQGPVFDELGALARQTR